jgi:electron transfer flavoprotein alpha subunit
MATRFLRVARGPRIFFSQRPFSALVYADHDNGKVSEATLSAVTAALQLDPHVDVLIAGESCTEAAKQATQIEGVKTVLVADSASLAHQSAENATGLIVELQKAKNYTFVVGTATANGKAVIPRVAAALDVAAISDVIKVKSADTFVRPIYAGNALATVRSKDKVKVLTVRPTAFEKAKRGTKETAVESVQVPAPHPRASKWVKDALSVSSRPELASAKIVVSGGRGVGSKDNFSILTELADNLGGALGASRAAVDAGYAPNDWQVGQTGKVVAPDLYIACGISGAIQHLAGMKDAKTIVAINKDPDAAIFQVADYGVVGDLFKVVPELSKLVAAAKK